MFEPLDPEQAKGLAATLLADTQRQLGRVPNLYRAMAHSPVALHAYLQCRQALQGGSLPAHMAERIALLVAQANDCGYCVAAHTFRGGRLGLSPEALMDTRHARSGDPAIHAALSWVQALITHRGKAPQALRDAVVAAGWSESQLGEMVAHVALNTLSNHFQHLALPPLDFPDAGPLVP